MAQPHNECIASVTAAMEIAGQENFFWSASTESLEDVSARAFEDDFYQAYSELKEVLYLVSA
eukprot:1159535-Pelagomonas_calceolata.AAC.6